MTVVAKAVEASGGGADAASVAVARPGATQVAVAFLGISLGVMVVTIMLTLFLPSEFGYGSCALLYAAKVYAERRNGITSPLSISLLFAYVVLLVTLIAGVDSTGYSGVVIFSWLLFVVGGLLVIGKPFTTFYSHGKGLPALHLTVSLIWITTYASALAATLLLMPNVLFVIVPALLCFAGGMATLFVNFVWCGKANERKTSFNKGEFAFRQISHDEPAFREFCELYGKGIANDPKQSDGTKTWQEVADVVESSERKLGADSVVFICTFEGRMVASIRCVLDRPGRPFPTEADIDSSFNELRKHGRLMLIGRLTIEDEFRGRPDIVNGLFACFVDLALEKDISFVLSAGFRHVLPIYMKLGFDFLFERSDRRHGVRMSHGFVSYPVVLDFTEMVMRRVDQESTKFDFYGVTNKFMAERWFKRTLLRRFLSRLAGKKPLVGLAAIRGAVVKEIPASAAPTAEH
ncbi:hypothetical protein [Ottowia sp.]|uniref:hypothetical protein n=1 Tax=Ottowia sp. TaxID=1898956 RepID=UPI0025CE1A81|nr:hypothetical protein [Ottowia sp.]MBK6616486.1 hypothetical protein [Ottowia sp.]